MINLRIFFRVLAVYIIALSTTSSAQSKTNLEFIYDLLDSAIVDISQNLSVDENLEIKYSSAPGLEFLSNRVYLRFNSSLNFGKGKSDLLLNFSLDNVNIRYNEIFRSWIFGDYLVEREAELSGSYMLINRNKIVNSNIFTCSAIDTVYYEEIENLENPAIPFTRSEIPAEPFFSSLLEPAIAIGAAAVTIFLFFNVRSK